jgi:hypothetical protein
MVAGLVSRIDVIRRPPPRRQVAVLGVLALKKLERQRKHKHMTSRKSAEEKGSRPRSRKPENGKNTKLTRAGGWFLSQGTSP